MSLSHVLRHNLPTSYTLGVLNRSVAEIKLVGMESPLVDTGWGRYKSGDLALVDLVFKVASLKHFKMDVF